MCVPFLSEPNEYEQCERFYGFLICLVSLGFLFYFIFTGSMAAVIPIFLVLLSMVRESLCILLVASLTLFVLNVFSVRLVQFSVNVGSRWMNVCSRFKTAEHNLLFRQWFLYWWYVVDCTYRNSLLALLMLANYVTVPISAR